MTRAPYVLSKASKPFARDIELFDTSLGWRFVNPEDARAMYGTDSMGQTAENVAEQYGISRDDQDAFALRSQQKAAAARSCGPLRRRDRAGGRFRSKKGDREARRRRTSSFAPIRRSRCSRKLKPAFRTDGKGRVTAGNCVGAQRRRGGAARSRPRSGVARAWRRRRWRASSRRRSPASSRACMGMGPVPAHAQALERAGLTLDDDRRHRAERGVRRAGARRACASSASPTTIRA